jgi:hydroxyacid-oxoacid transhydrogenase
MKAVRALARKQPLLCLRRSRCFSTTTSGEVELDSICELAASNLRYGRGATKEVGQDLSQHFRCRNVVVFTDPVVRQLACFDTLQESLEQNGVHYTVYDEVRVEPNDVSFRHAIDFLRKDIYSYDGVVALGGGSVIDTAKAANLYACHPPKDFYDYVNAPTGKNLPIPGKVKPLIAIPTTAGTGSETTGVAIFDDSPTRCKTAIANRHLKPALGILDPANTETMPRKVATYSGLDVICHAMESYTALPFNLRPKPSSPVFRPAYQGSNPISDVWSLFALETAARALPLAVVENEQQEQAQSEMLLASSAAGMGFGNAGVHLCHGMSYPISAQVKDSYKGKAYEHVVDHALVPHGLSVIVSAPAVFSWTAVACPERHERVAQILQSARWQREGKARSTSTKQESSDIGLWLADEIRDLGHCLDVNLGLRQFGYNEEDIPDLVDGTIQQHRVTKISLRHVERADLEGLFLKALQE